MNAIQAARLLAGWPSGFGLVGLTVPEVYAPMAPPRGMGTAPGGAAGRPSMGRPA